MNRVALITPHFGEFPIWFDLYLYSCSLQHDIVDYYFYTDCKPPCHNYKNTFFINTSFKDYCGRVSEVLGITFTPDSPYKLCDLKPFLGLIHPEISSKYEFWGFADIDLLYGNLKIVVNDLNLKKYDVITTHTNRVAGHFTIVRSNSKLTNSCLNIPNWEELLCNKNHMSIDEDEWVFVLYPAVRQLRRIYHYIFRPLHIPMKYCYEGLLNKLFNNRFSRRCFHEYGTTPIPEAGQVWTYNPISGDLINPKGVQIPYLHFLFFKKTPYKIREIFWRDDFYKLESFPLTLNSPKEPIIIDVNSIRYGNQ